MSISSQSILPKFLSRDYLAYSYVSSAASKPWRLETERRQLWINSREMMIDNKEQENKNDPHKVW